LPDQFRLLVANLEGVNSFEKNANFEQGKLSKNIPMMDCI